MAARAAAEERAVFAGGGHGSAANDNLSAAGIESLSATQLVIDGEGVVVARGYRNAAGIGGGDGGHGADAWPAGQEGEGGETLWRVEVRGLPPVTGVCDITGLEALGVTEAVASAGGRVTIYLPSSDTQYDFAIDGLSFHALVADAPAIAWYETGMTVDGVDLETQGRSYDGATGILSLMEANRTYTLGGTNAVWDVVVDVEAKGVNVIGDRLHVNSVNGNSFVVAKNASLTITSGTLKAGAVTNRVTVLGGSIDASLAAPVDAFGTSLHKVVLRGLEPGSGISGVSRITGDSETSSLANYDFSGIFADDAGCIYLWLPDGDYEFAIGDVNYAATVAGEDTKASSFRYTGVYINGVDAGKPHGFCWSNDCGRVVLYNVSDRWGDQGFKTDYVITGTNTGAAVCFSVEVDEQVYITLDNLVMTNPEMTASPFQVSSNESSLFRLAGTNILTCVVDDYPAIGLTHDGKFILHTNEVAGVLYATGAGSAAAIGPIPGEDEPYVGIYGGTVIAVGGPTAGYYIISRDWWSDYFRISRASVHLAGTGSNDPRPSTGYWDGNKPLYCVTIPDFAPGQLIDESIYGSWPLSEDDTPGSGWIADEAGRIYLWLPNGEYTFTHDGCTYRAVVEDADIVAELIDGEPPTRLKELTISSIAVSETSVTLVVSADPAQWLAAHAAELRVRASETLPMDGGELLDPADVETIVNPDGTVSLVVGEPNRFYRVELTQ